MSQLLFNCEELKQDMRAAETARDVDAPQPLLYVFCDKYGLPDAVSCDGPPDAVCRDELPDAVSRDDLAESAVLDYIDRMAAGRDNHGNPSVKVLRDSRGKPFVRLSGGCGVSAADAGISKVNISITHTDGLWACLVSDFRAGIDAECQGRDFSAERADRIAARYFTREEQGYIRGDVGRFFRVWTRKEAYLKYTGEGLSGGMGSFDVLCTEGFAEPCVGDGYAVACYMGGAEPKIGIRRARSCTQGRSILWV